MPKKDDTYINRHDGRKVVVLFVGLRPDRFGNFVQYRNTETNRRGWYNLDYWDREWEAARD